MSDEPEITFDGSPVHGYKLNVAGLDDDVLGELLDQARTEYQRRRDVAAAVASTPTLAAPMQAALGREPGALWEQPLGAFDAYPEGWETEHDGRMWVSLVPANTFTPGVSGWRELPGADGTPPEWVQPAGAHDTYSKGDLVTFEGAVWESELDHNPYPPSDYGWTRTSTEE